MTNSTEKRANSPVAWSSRRGRSVGSSRGSSPSIRNPSEREKEHATIQDIIRLSKERHYTTGKKVPLFFEHLACFQVRAAAVQFPQRFKLGLSMEDGKDYMDLLEHCIHNCTQENCPALETIRLQITAQATAFLELKACAEERVNEAKVLQTILADIPQIQVIDMRETFKTVELLHGRILDYMMECGRQIADNVDVTEEMEAEITTTFKSIFPQESCLFWMDLPSAEKERQVVDIAAVIQGVRIYNKHLSKGGKTLSLPFDLYKQEKKMLSEKVLQLLQILNERTHVSASAITLHIHSLGIQHVLIQRLRDELNYHLQAFAILEDFQSFLDERFAFVTDLMDQFSWKLNVLCDIISDRPCVATELVFPQFKALGNLHKSMLEELRLLRAHQRACIPFLSMAAEPQFDCTPTGFANLWKKTGWTINYHTDWKNSPLGLAKLKVLIMYTTFLQKDLYNVTWDENDALIKAGSSNEGEGRVLTSCEIDAAFESEREIHLGGYCPVTLAKYRGLLLHGDPDVGLVEFEEKLFAFSTEEDLREFARSPSLFLRTVENVVHKMPQLVHLLRLQQCPKLLSLAISEIIDLLSEPFSCEFSTQTAIHIGQPHRWTDEAFYERALELQNKLTDSTQTETSYFKRTSSTQVAYELYAFL
ncbi:hypothetical protein SELMODRAFT_430641 [Selaginella moellendorffii]|uniref:Cilia- and flagella-associated protein 206 n=1 Tax=Selaginella moellendorffii TaxID=88036 RepID=D8TA16_SELML|nr:hypothetical protein SELMODRAFT_430641 [Selaginella moellendorffii]